MFKMPDKRELFVIIVLLAAMLVMNSVSFAVDIFAVETLEDGLKTGPALSKGASIKEKGQWEVRLTIDGNHQYERSDVVLIMDRSKSMAENGKIKEARKAAAAFVDHLLQENSNNRIAIVTFSDQGEILADFSGYEESVKLKKEINNIKAVGSTHIQAGIYEAERLLAQSDADLKSIVLLGDGEPNYSFRVTGVKGISADGCRTENGFHTYQILKSNPVITSVNINETVGTGAKYELAKGDSYIVCCSHGYAMYSDFPGNHGVATLYEADKAKSQNINFYSIALGESSDLYHVLEQCQNAGYYKLADSDFSELSSAYLAIAGRILSPDVEGTVEDVIGEDFELVPNTLSSSQGTVQYDKNSKKIIWKTGNISAQESAELSYCIRFQAKIRPDDRQWYETNQYAKYVYVCDNGKEGEGVFPVPMVRVIEDGETIQETPKLIKEDHFAYVKGYPDGSVKPLDQITREEVAAIFYRLLTADCRALYETEKAYYQDVPQNHWSSKEIGTLTNAKILTGYGDGSFRPNQPITRAEFAAISAKFDDLEAASSNLFSDIHGHWARNVINSASLKGWISGYGDGRFQPDQPIIRCEAMKLINEVLDRRVDAKGIHKDAVRWPDNPEEEWYYEIVMEATNSHDYERADKPKSTETWTEIKGNKGE